MIVTFDQPAKVVEISDRVYIVLLPAVRQALRSDLVLRDFRGEIVGRIVATGLVLGSVWVELEELPAPQP